ncbi:hypothetical protein NDU88_003834 [Pleurodeles waltl]|uniref:Uncharacterized protein n=1 Tax=Pleurodeles waltl TaxID=8319 RepID=A0AAV7KYJ4_PLEWA|nr:hypothetical protein NDU88_003834 [Pleurodeles waltl]
MRDTIKSYIRGQEQRQWVCCEQIEAAILDLEGRTGCSDAPAVQRQLVLAWSELRQISLEEAKQCWQASTGRVYEMGDKSGKLLYWLATHGAAARVVPAIHDREGNTQVELEAISQAFAAYYQDLYAKDPLPYLKVEGSQVWDLPVPTILPTPAQDLDQPLTAEEVDTAISELSGGKTARPDGYLVEYYKQFSSILVPHLLNFHDEALKTGNFLPELDCASIVVLPKGGQAPDLGRHTGESR